MSRHRLEPARRVRPRYGRIGAAGLSLTVTLVALLGSIGLIPLDSAASQPDPVPAASGDTSGPSGGAGSAATPPATSPTPVQPSSQASSQAVAPQGTVDPAVPPASGEGRRVVFSKSAQRVWLVGADGTAASTYLVSGSVTDNLRPGRYHVYSRSRWAVGVDDSGVMQYFVRFAHGPKAAIGFHSIPTRHGTPLQTEAQLGTPRSHGCIRQKLSDALRMWDFAGVGTDVVVLA